MPFLVGGGWLRLWLWLQEGSLISLLTLLLHDVLLVVCVRRLLAGR